MSARRDQSVTYIKGVVSVKLLLPEASFPSKEEGRESNIGYDVTLVQRCDNRSEDSTHEVNKFRTGLSLTPPPGYYVEMIARESLHKHGYFLATGTSIIDPGFTGEIIVPLYKYKEVDDLELPFQAVQFVVKPAVYSYMAGVKNLPTRDVGRSAGLEFSTSSIPQGVYIPDMQNSEYGGDMSAYKTQVQSHSKGQPRPQAAPRGNNHMF